MTRRKLNSLHLDLYLARRGDHSFISGRQRCVLALCQRQIEAVVNRVTQVCRQFEGPFRKLFERNNAPIVGDGDLQVLARLSCGHIAAKDGAPDRATYFGAGEGRGNQIIVRRSDRDTR